MKERTKQWFRNLFFDALRPSQAVLFLPPLPLLFVWCTTVAAAGRCPSGAAPGRSTGLTRLQLRDRFAEVAVDGVPRRKSLQHRTSVIVAQLDADPAARFHVEDISFPRVNLVLHAEGEAGMHENLRVRKEFLELSADSATRRMHFARKKKRWPAHFLLNNTFCWELTPGIEALTH